MAPDRYSVYTALGLTYTQQDEFRKTIDGVGPQHKTKEGGLWLTRLKNALFKGHKYKVEGTSATKLGELAQMITGRFRDRMDWSSGEYGDLHSCFLEGNEAAPIALARMGVKFFTVEKGGQGVGRCMVWQRKDYALVFGGNGLASDNLGRVIAAANGMQAHEGLYVFTCKTRGHNLYGFGSGVLIHKPGADFPKSSVQGDHGYANPCCTECRQDTKGTFTASPDGRAIYCAGCRPHYGGQSHIKYGEHMGFKKVGPKQID